MSYTKCISVILIMLLVYPAIGAPIYNADGYEMKYKDNNPIHATPSVDDVTGKLIVRIRAGGSAEDLIVFVIREDTLNLTRFDTRYHPDGTVIVGQNSKYKQIEILPNGESLPVRLTPGKYGAYLRNGDGGQPEMYAFVIGAKETTYVSFLGHAVSSKSCNVFKVVKAMYGAEKSCEIVWHPPRIRIVHHDAEYENVIDVPEHTEYRYWISDVSGHNEYSFRDWIPAVMGEECFEEVNHTEMQGNTTHTEMIGNTTHTEMIGNTTHTEMQGNTTHTESMTTVCEGTAGSPATPATGRLAEYEVGHVHAVWTMNCPVDAECFEVGRLPWNKYRVTSDESASAFVIISHGTPGVGREADYELGHVHARHETVPSQIDFYYGASSMHITGNKHDKAYIVTPGTPEIPDTRKCVDGKWVDDGCSLSRNFVMCVPTNPCAGCGVCTEHTIDNMDGHLVDVDNMDGHLVDVDNMDGHIVDVDNMDGHLEIVVDERAHCDPIITSPAHWSDWSEWSDTLVTAIPDQREVQTRFISDDMMNGHYSDWSDNAEGSCVVSFDMLMSIISNEPCQTRHVDATYKQVIVKEPWDETIIEESEWSETVCAGGMIDVTEIVKGLVNHNKLHIASTEYNTLFGDPAPNQFKYLTIEYTLNGIDGTKTVGEDTDINLP